MADPERELAQVVKKYESAKARLDEMTEERIEAVRKARAAGVTQKRVIEITGLSRQRVNQIVRGEAFTKAHRERMRARRAA